MWQEVCHFINDKYNLPDGKKMTVRNIQNYVAQDRNGILFDLQNISHIENSSKDIETKETLLTEEKKKKTS